MDRIIINNISYNLHPIYNTHGADINGNIINISNKQITKGNLNKRGYLIVCVKKPGIKSNKIIQAHRFIYECFNNIINDNKVIDHKNDNCTDNRLCNLKLVTQQENCKKSAKNRDYTFAKYNHENKRCIKAINQNTEEISYYKSMYSAQKSLGINAGIIKMVCEGLNNCKSGISKINSEQYKFEYIKADDQKCDIFGLPKQQ